MGLDVYFRRDIANVLRATACASETSAGLAIELLGETAGGSVPAEKLLHVYREGVRHTLVSVGLAFGLEPTINQKDDRGLVWRESLTREGER